MIYIFQFWIIILFIGSVFNINKRIIGLTYFIGFILLVVSFYPRIVREYKINESKKLSLLETTSTIQILQNNSIFFIVGEGYGDPFPQVAQYFGCLWSGRYLNNYKEELKKLYPSVLFYDFWYKKFLFWHDEIPSEILQNPSNKSFFVFLGRDDEATKALTMNNLGQLFPSDSIMLELVYNNKEKNEGIYSLIIDGKNSGQ